MLYPLGVLLVTVSGVLLGVGGRGRRPLALHVAEALWLPGVVLAVYFTVIAWHGQGAGENWEAMPVLYLVWPYSVVIGVLGLVELVLLGGRRDRHARLSRAITSAYLIILAACSAIGAACM